MPFLKQRFREMFRQAQHDTAGATLPRDERAALRLLNRTKNFNESAVNRLIRAVFWFLCAPPYILSVIPSVVKESRGNENDRLVLIVLLSPKLRGRFPYQGNLPRLLGKARPYYLIVPLRKQRFREMFRQAQHDRGRNERRGGGKRKRGGIEPKIG